MGTSLDVGILYCRWVDCGGRWEGRWRGGISRKVRGWIRGG